ncbi:hypothetical protein GGR56DRAFT_161921 [Xylariaceae sp. FL0804]|nr:hypothetical protein GGR56DRAFT_161921 [Xylariaceae sp. FL0804]
MAIDTPLLKLRTYFRSRREKRRRTDNSPPPCEPSKRRRDESAAASPVVEELKEESRATAALDPQLNSPLFQKLPIEIRKMIYAHVWPGRHDHRYHIPNGQHLHFSRGHWTRTRCVMYKDEDEDLDFLQKAMDAAQSAPCGNMLMWQRRLASTWGSRHWRCAERVEHSTPTHIDHKDLGAMMVVCRRMHPEVIESFLETHRLIFNDLYSAHRFFVQAPSPHVAQVRDLDLTLHVPHHECLPAGLELEDGEPKKNGNRVRQLLAALGPGRRVTCPHGLRIAVDIWDRGPWRSLPDERALLRQIAGLVGVVRAGGRFTVELPPAALSIGEEETPVSAREEEESVDDRSAATATMAETETYPFSVVRRPALRFWEFSPGEVQPFTWKTEKKDGEQQRTWIALSKEPTLIPNPYVRDMISM